MELSKRQIDLMQLFINKQNSFLQVDELVRQFNVCEKTIRNDFKVVNLALKDKHIHIHNARGHGYYLASHFNSTVEKNDHHKIQSLLCQNGLQSLRQRKIVALKYLFTHYGNFYTKDLARKIHVSPRSALEIIHCIRQKLSAYDLQILSCASKGLIFTGSEIDKRYCYIDSMHFYTENNMHFFEEDSPEHFGILKEDIQKISDLCLRYIKSSHISISQNSYQKLVLILLVCKQRNENGFIITGDELAKKNAYICDRINSSFLKLHILFTLIKNNFAENFITSADRYFIKMFLLCYVAYTQDSLCYFPDTVMKRQLHVRRVIENTLKHLGILSDRKVNSFRIYFAPLFITLAFRTLFKVTENHPDQAMETYIENSPLSVCIGSRISDCIEKEFSIQLGQAENIVLYLAVYEWIRSINTLCKKNMIAILTPLSDSFGISLKQRVLDRFSNMINKIDIYSFDQALVSDMSKYNCILYFAENTPLDITNSPRCLKVSYYFTNEDVSNFYENFAIPSRKYIRAFGSSDSFEYIKCYAFSDLNQLKNDLENTVVSSELKEQIKKFSFHAELVCNQTLNMIFFVRKPQHCFSKLITLKHAITIHSSVIRRIFIHVIHFTPNLIALKTTEKVIRNLTTISDTDEVVLKTPYIDFFNYYIYFRQDPLKKQLL